MNNNGITEIESQTFAGLGSVTTLDLSNNNITEIESQGFAGLGSITRLDLSNNNITSLVAKGLVKFFGSSFNSTIILKGNPADTGCWTGGRANSSGIYVNCMHDRMTIHSLTRVPTFINPNITHV